jgi:hypothetical protein
MDLVVETSVYEKIASVRPEADCAPHAESYLAVRPEEARSLRRLEG